MTITCIRYVFFNYISKDTYGDRKRSFKAEWDKIHSWLEYSRILDTDIVMPVNILALPIAQSRFLRVVSKTGRRQPTRKGDLEFRSERHKQAMVAWKDYETAVKKKQNFADVLNKEHDKQIKDNWEYMKTIAEVLLLTATQNIAQGDTMLCLMRNG